MTVASLDRPEDIEPNYHIFAGTRLAWLKLNDRLPAHDDWGPDV